MKTIYVRCVGKDLWNRNLYLGIQTNDIYVDIDIFNNENEFNELYAITEQGEPDYPIRNVEFIATDKAMNMDIADRISKLLIDLEIAHDTTIYFNNTAYELYDNKKTVYYNKLASNHTMYANDVTVTMIFEGELHRYLNGYKKYKYDDGTYINVYKEIDSIANEYGYYFEMGESWCMSLYKI